MHIYEHRVKGGQNFVTILNNEGSGSKIKKGARHVKDITNNSTIEFQNF